MLLPVHPVLPLQSPQLLLLRPQRRPLGVLRRVEEEDDQVPPADVEAREAVGGVFGVEDVLEDDEGGALCGLSLSKTHLAYRAVLAEDVVELLGGDSEGEVADKEDSVFSFEEGGGGRESGIERRQVRKGLICSLAFFTLCFTLLLTGSLLDRAL